MIFVGFFNIYVTFEKFKFQKNKSSNVFPELRLNYHIHVDTKILHETFCCIGQHGYLGVASYD